jgi:hypothetical protein
MNYYIIAALLIITFAISFVFFKHSNEAYNRNEIKFNKLTTSPFSNTNNYRVLVFNSFSYTDKTPEYAKYSSIVTKAYSDMYGYDYKQFNHLIDKMPPYWLRVKDTYDMLMTGVYDVIIYLDLDATFHNFELSINDIIDDRYDFYVGADPVNIERADFNNLVNTGCFIVKNTMWSRQFIKTWLNGCMNIDGNLAGVCETSWKYHNEKWHCPACKWAGLKYEQGSLANLYIMNVHEARKHVCIFEESILSNKFPKKKSYILHLMASTNNDRTIIFKKLAEKTVA